MNAVNKTTTNNNNKMIIIMTLSFLLLAALTIIFEKKDAILSSLNDSEININKLVINEIMTNNDGAYVDASGNPHEWIELYNGTAKDIDLYDYGLSDQEDGSIKWKFPRVTIGAGEYLIVHLTKGNEPGLYANFSLKKAGGELLTLKKPNGKVADAVKIEALKENTVMARNSEGVWVITKDITAGFSNNTSGIEEYLASLRAQVDNLIISEVLPKNNGNFITDGAFYGYIEIQNQGDEPVNLKEYFLSDNEATPYLWQLPDIVLEPNGIYYAYDSKLNNESNTNFGLKSKNGVVILAHKNKIVDTINYENLSSGYALIRINDEFVEDNAISPGYANDAAGIQKFLQEQNKNPNDLIISEVMNSNKKFFAQNGGLYYSYITLYNNSNETINLGDYTLTTDEESKNMYALENKNLKKGEFYVLMASGDTSLSNDKYQHASFKLSKTESLYLYKKGKITDSMFISDIPIGGSYGRNEKNGFYYFSNPTPQTMDPVGSGYPSISIKPVVSTLPGIYNDITSLEVNISGTGVIHYTTDGSTPTTSSNVYTKPITLNKTTVIRSISSEKSKMNSEVVTTSYIINENHTLPVMSISLSPSAFNSVYGGHIAKNATKSHAELFEDGSGFSIDCGLRLFGGAGRQLPKKSMNLEFSKAFGPSSLEYKVFDNREAIEFNNLTLRSGSQDYPNSMIRDELGTGVVDDYGTIDVLAYKPIILYINGNYWGVYFLREKTSPELVQHHYNVSPEGTNIFRIDGDISVGSRTSYLNLLDYVNKNDISQAENYEYVKSKLDVENYIDFWIAVGYVFHEDVRNIRYFSNPNVEGGKFKMIFYDLDHAFYWNDNYFTFMTRPGGITAYHNFENVLIRNLMRNSEFKALFIERLSYNMNEVWSDKNVLGKYNELYNTLEPEMARNQTRWGSTKEHWINECNKLEKYLKSRRNGVLRTAKAYFGLTEEEMKKYFE